MGTSASYIASPNWSNSKSELTRNSGSSLGRGGASDFVRKHITNNGGAGSTASGRGVLGSGKSAKTTAARLGGLFSGFSRDGFEETMRRFGLQDMIGKPIKEIFRAIQEFLDMPGNSIDETDARAALMDLFEELEKDADDDIETALQNKTTSDVIVSYFGYYIYEQMRRLHFEDEIKNQIGDNPERHLEEIKEIIQYNIRTIMIDEDCSKIDWFGKEGKTIVNKVIKSVLNSF